MVSFFSARACVTSHPSCALSHNLIIVSFIHSGKSMIRILDDILLVAKGSRSLDIKEETVDVSEFLRQTVADMTNFAYMEGLSVRVRKEDVSYPLLFSDFNRIRQVIHNLISNAIKFSEEDIQVECLQRRTFAEVLTVWRTYAASYPNHEPRLKILLLPKLVWPILWKMTKTAAGLFSLWLIEELVSMKPI